MNQSQLKPQTYQTHEELTKHTINL